MTDQPRRAGSILILAVGILLAVVLVVIFLAPLAKCRNCEIELAIQRGIVGLRPVKPSAPSPPVTGCEQCWRGKISLYRKWRLEHGP